MSALVLTNEDRQALALAKERLENPGLSARVANVVGVPIEGAIQRLPAGWQKRVDATVRLSLKLALRSAVGTMKADDAGPPRDRAHVIASGVSGVVGGFFGLPGLLVELPLSTTLLVRSIADIARANGENPRDPHTALACLEVFSFGGRSIEDDAAEHGYFAARIALAKAVSEAAAHLAARGLSAKSAPPLVKLISAVGSRFGVTVSQKAAAMAVPAIGAAGAATLNAVFMRHYQSMAHGHFTVRSLERRYGEEVVQRAWLEG